MNNTPPRNSITLFQWNCHGINNKRELLPLIDNGTDHDILALSETWLSPEIDFHLKNFHIICCDGPSKHSGGTLLAVRDWIPFTKVSHIFDSVGTLEAVGISITSLSFNNPILIISIYRHPGNANPLL
ncbi:rna-directed dna polymerase from mobile element jockey [Lasius niger]|uniref:Rna-directed dna polymerase from mobile element jockey n=1 Tax=Lasius niger TaxID=67767 RepID=A0A0J7K343_LASNI|nr:rna-directed dna polymerase from mobile element jockey [Lasius niger]